MNAVANIPELTLQRIEEVESKLLNMDQVECPVRHRFGSGIYIREVTLPSGMLAIGHYHKTEHMNIMLSGRATFLMPDGSTEEFIAPRTQLFPPGRKIAFVHERMIWQNVFPTKETDLVKLESEYLDKSDAFLNNQNRRLQMEWFQHEVDREDFLKAISEMGYSKEQVRAISENELDQIPFPDGNYAVTVAESPIQGMGLFATIDFKSGDMIAISRKGNFRTPAGRFANHSACPNSIMESVGDSIFLMAKKNIKGCLGGQPGDEITVDYRQVVRIQPEIKEESCQLLQ